MQYPNNRYHLKYRISQVAFFLFAFAVWFLIQITWFLCAARGDWPGLIATAVMILISITICYLAYHFQDYYGRLHKFLNKPLKDTLNSQE